MKLDFHCCLSITSDEKSFILSFSKQWSLSSGNKFFTSANVLTALTVFLFRGSNVETWLGFTRVNTEGGLFGLFSR